MAFEREMDGADPTRGRPVAPMHEERLDRRGAELAVGTLACPHCDLPVAPPGRLSPADPLGCPFCAHAGRVRDFLSLETPSRPARVVVRVLPRRSAAA
jgi:hypothetical protein